MIPLRGRFVSELAYLSLPQWLELHELRTRLGKEVG